MSNPNAFGSQEVQKIGGSLLLQKVQNICFGDHGSRLRAEVPALGQRAHADADSYLADEIRTALEVVVPYSMEPEDREFCLMLLEKEVRLQLWGNRCNAQQLQNLNRGWRLQIRQLLLNIPAVRDRVTEQQRRMALLACRATFLKALQAVLKNYRCESDVI